MTYKTDKLTSDYLKPFCKNKYVINNMPSFACMTNSVIIYKYSIDETIDYIIQSIYIYKKLDKSAVI